jgi:hypothetical protein
MSSRLIISSVALTALMVATTNGQEVSARGHRSHLGMRRSHSLLRASRIQAGSSGTFNVALRNNQIATRMQMMRSSHTGSVISSSPDPEATDRSIRLSEETILGGMAA